MYIQECNIGLVNITQRKPIYLRPGTLYGCTFYSIENNHIRLNTCSVCQINNRDAILRPRMVLSKWQREWQVFFKYFINIVYTETNSGNAILAIFPSPHVPAIPLSRVLSRPLRPGGPIHFFHSQSHFHSISFHITHNNVDIYCVSKTDCVELSKHILSNSFNQIWLVHVHCKIAMAYWGNIPNILVQRINCDHYSCFELIILSFPVWSFSECIARAIFLPTSVLLPHHSLVQRSFLWICTCFVILVLFLTIPSKRQLDLFIFNRNVERKRRREEKRVKGHELTQLPLLLFTPFLYISLDAQFP